MLSMLSTSVSASGTIAAAINLPVAAASQKAAPPAIDVEPFAAALEECKPATQEMPHPLMPNVMIKHTVTGEKDGKCAYTQSMPGNMSMECAFTPETRKGMADQLRWMAKDSRVSGSTKAPMPEWMKECEIVMPSGQRVPAAQTPRKKPK
jgi:hypothetical protein